MLARSAQNSLQRLLDVAGAGFKPAHLARFLKELERPTRQAPLEVVEATRRALNRARGLNDLPSLARLLRARAHALRAASRYDEARSDYLESVDLFLRLGEGSEAAISRIGLIDTLMYLGDYASAALEAGRARAHFLKAKDPIRRARVETNMGNIHQRRDDPARALQCYDRARRTFRRLEDPGSLALVEVNRGTVLSSLGRLDQARAAFETARQVFASRRLSARTGQIDYNLAYLLFLENRLPEALEALARVRAELETLGDRRHMALCRMDEAEILLRLHLWEDAAVSARSALAGFSELGMNYEAGRATAFLGTAVLLAGDADTAEAHFKDAAGRFEKEGNKVWLAETALALSHLELGRGRWAAALAWAEKARNGFRPSSWSDGLGRAYLVVAAARRGQGEVAGAAPFVERGLKEARRLRSPWLMAEAYELRGLLAFDRGEAALARRSFRAAIRELERLRVLLTGDDLRAGFLRDRDRPYVALAQTELAAGRPREAFAALERGRAVALLDMIASLGGRRRSGEKLRELERQAEGLLMSLSRQYHNDTIIGESGRSRSAAVAMAPTRLSALESQASRLLSRIGRGRANRTGTAPIRESSIRQVLDPDEALIAYFETEGRLQAFVLRRDEFRHCPDLAETGEISRLIEGLRFQWGRFRVDPTLPDRHAGQLLRMATDDLKELYDRVLAPVDPGTRKLVLVPTALLRDLPFGALYDGAYFAAQRRAISICPSSAVFRSCRLSARERYGALDAALDRHTESNATRGRNAESSLARGRHAESSAARGRKAESNGAHQERINSGIMPDIRGRRALLMGLADRVAPHVSGEIDDLKELFRGATVFKGSRATVRTFLREAPHHDVIHLATHGVFRTERPNLSGVRLADRWLYGYDVARLALRARLVTISACATGESAAWGHGEWPGLARSFLSAGASQVLVSLWEIDDAATRQLMEGFYKAWLGGNTASEALSLTQSAMAAGGFHPYYWSGFSLLGDL